MLLGKIRHGDSAGHLALDLEMTQRWGGEGRRAGKLLGVPEQLLRSARNVLAQLLS